jgi:capsular exopolysaccharide synthesis family protein
MEMKQYLSILWHWAWLICLGVLVAGGTAYIVSKKMTPVYRASIHLLINQAPGESAGNEFTQIQVSERLARTYSELIKKRPVLEETMIRLDLPFDVETFARNISVSVTRDTQIMVVSIEDIDRERTALIANTLVEVFIAQNQELHSARYAEAIGSWERAVEEVGSLIESLDAQIATLGSVETPAQEATLARLEPQLTQARAHYNETFKQLQSLRVSQAREVNNVVVVEPAVPAQQPMRPRVLQNTILAAVLGGMLALGLVFLIEHMDDTLKTPDQVAEDTGLSTLSAIAVINGDKDKASSKLAAHHLPRSPVAEAYRVLRTNLSFAAIDDGLRSVLITSSSPSEGKSTTAGNLGVVMAQAGKQVIIVDADLRRPTQHKLFETGNNHGLTTALLDGQTPLTDHLQETAITGLRLLTSGPLPPNPAELLNSQRMHQLVESLQAEADLVIFDSPPVLTVADASILAAQVAGSVLVASVGVTRRDALVQAAESLHKAGATLYGVVMNRVRTGRSGYYNYYYRYYHYEYATAPQPRKWLPAWVGTWIGRS